MNRSTSSRRDFLASAAGAAVAASGAACLPGGVASATAAEGLPARFPKGKAEHCVFLWLGGGPSQIDTFDPKRRGNPKKREPGSDYDAIKTAVKGVEICEHLPRTADLLDRATLVRTVHHDVIDEHAAAVNRMHTGRPVSGTIQYPSIGSVVAHELGAAGAGVPPYIIMGYPNLTRGPGFLGAEHGFVYLTETQAGPQGLARHEAITDSRQRRRESLLQEISKPFVKQNAGTRVADYAKVAKQGFELAGPDFMSAFNLEEEPKSLRESYGDEFGQRCLLSRRLIQRGVRFIEVAHNLNFINGTGWDTHNQGQLKQHILIRELDNAFATLITDLEKHKLLDKTLIVIAGEFGRPAGFDGGGGRGHQSTTFSTVLAGGGLNNGQAIGQTDELSKKILSRPVSVPDFFATMHCALGIDPSKNLYDGDRPVPITDMGKPIDELFS